MFNTSEVTKTIFFLNLFSNSSDKIQTCLYYFAFLNGIFTTVLVSTVL